MMISLSPILLLSLLSSPSRTSHAFTPGAQHHGSQIRSSSSSSTTTRLLNYLDSLSSPSQEGFGGSQIGRPSSGRGGDDPANRPRMDPWSTTTPAPEPAPATTTNEVTETPVDEKVTPPVVNSNSNNDSPNMVAATPSFAQQLKGDTTTTSTPAATVGENSGPADSKKDPKKTITSKIESSSSSYLDSIERWYKNTLSGSSASRDPMYLDSIEMWYKNTLSGSSTADASYLQTLPSIDPLSGPGTQMSYLDMVNDPPMRVTPETIEAVNAAAAAVASNKGTDDAPPVTAASVEDAFAALMEAKVRYDTEATQFDPLKPPPSAVQAAKTAAAVSRLQKTINPGNNDDAVTATTTNDATTTTSDQIDAADALAAAVMKLRKEKEELEKSNKDLQSKLTTRGDELMDLEEQVATTRATLTTAKATATVEMKELDATVTALRTEKDDLQVTIGTLKDDVQTAQSDLATLKEKLESTRSQLDGAQRAVAKKKTLDARVLELEAEKEELETQTSTLQVEVTDLGNDLTALQQEVATIQSQVDAAKEEAVVEQAKQEASTKERTAQEEIAALERTKTDAAAIEKAKEEAAAVIAQAKEEAAAVTEKAAAAMEKAKEEAAAVVAEAAAVVEKAKKEAASAIEQARQEVAAAAEKAADEAAAIKEEAAATAKKAAAADAQAKKEAAASEKAEKEAAAAKAEKEAVIKAQEAAAATEKAEKEAAAAKAKEDAAAAEKAEKEAAVAKAREDAAATEKAEKEVAVAKAKEATAATEKAEKEAIAVKKAEEEAAAVEEAVKGAIAKAEKEAALVAEKTQKDAAAAATEKVEKKEAAVVAEQTKVEDTFGNTKKGKRARKKAEKAAAAEKAKQEALAKRAEKALAKRAEKAAAKQPKPVASKPVIDAPEKEVVVEKTENPPAVSAEESMKAALKLTTLAPESEEPTKIPVKAAATPAPKEAVSSVPMPTQNENVISATPKAKSAAKKAKIDLATITGSGKFGRITAEDVANAMNKKKGRASKILRKEVSPAKMRNDFVPFTSMQRAISKNMVNSLDTPVFRVSLDIETDKLDKVYQRLKRQGVSVSALLAKAVALAIEEHPIINSSYSPDGGVIQHPDINIAMAVAIEGGLATPTIHNANEYDVLEIGKRWRKLVKKAKKGTLTPEEYKGGTFAISNMGMFGVTQFDAILPAGMGGILAIGATRNIMEPDETEFIKAREVHKMNVTLTCDHRQIYGTDAVKFLNTLDDILNNGLHRIWS